MLEETLYWFKLIDFIQHFIKEEKNHAGWCWMKFIAEQTAKVHVGFVYSGLTSKILFSTPFQMLILMFSNIRTSIRISFL